MPIWRMLACQLAVHELPRGDDYTQNTSLYCAHSGAFVFATGTMDWAWGLAPGGSSDGTKNNVRPALQRMTVNVLGRMIRNTDHRSS